MKYHRTAASNSARGHCEYCGGLGKDLIVEHITSPLGIVYRVPPNHKACKESILSLSLSLSLDEPNREKVN